MIRFGDALNVVIEAQRTSDKPLAVVVAGHNGSGKSTMWYRSLAETLRIPLINADRMMLSILPEAKADGFLPDWAAELRDTDESWMRVAQNGVQAFVAQALTQGVPFAMETVFSHWRVLPNGTVETKVDLIRQMQAAGYFVVLLFVGLSSEQVSIGRVATRTDEGGHDVDIRKLIDRFPRTQNAIRLAAPVADATVFLDNSRTKKEAFTVCRVQLGEDERFDMRATRAGAPSAIEAWMIKVCPTHKA
ncbi:MAG: zeta toxin family protein [Caulobacterales bacterium]|nr:zeta toxin family protein [Caulobacterales bacterium]